MAILYVLHSQTLHPFNILLHSHEHLVWLHNNAPLMGLTTRINFLKLSDHLAPRHAGEFGAKVWGALLWLIN